MKYVIAVILSLLVSILFCTIAFGKDNNIYIYQNGKVIGQMSPEEYIALVKGSEVHAEELLSEAEGRVIFELLDNPYKVDSENLYHVKLNINWKDKDGKIFKYIQIQNNVRISEIQGQPYPEWRVTYRNISEIGFPVTAGILTIIVLVLSL